MQLNLFKSSKSSSLNKGIPRFVTALDTLLFFNVPLHLARSISPNIYLCVAALAVVVLVYFLPKKLLAERIRWSVCPVTGVGVGEGTFDPTDRCIDICDISLAHKVVPSTCLPC